MTWTDDWVRRRCHGNEAAQALVNAAKFMAVPVPIALSCGAVRSN